MTAAAPGPAGAAPAALGDLAGTLMALDRPQGERRDAAHGLHRLLADLSGMPLGCRGDDGVAGQDSLLPDGLALSPAYAALCVLDHNRTGAFAAGLASAIHRSQTRFPGQRIRVLYAGTGPFAPLTLLQCPRFRPQEVGFTLLDIHRHSLDAARHIYAALGCDGYIEAVHAGDATAFAPEGPPFHIAVAEVMQRALKKEPQVAVTRHVAGLLHPGGLMVPERIALDLALFDIASEYDPLTGWTGPGDRAHLGTAFELTAVAGHAEKPAGVLPLADVRLPGRPAGRLQILTRITAAPGIDLGENDSGLTTTCTANPQPPLPPGGTLAVAYQMGADPGLRFAARV